MDQFFLILPRYSLFKFTLLINLPCSLFYPAFRFLSLFDSANPVVHRQA